jgi:FtsH-binding integral membrane protein
MTKLRRIIITHAIALAAAGSAFWWLFAHTPIIVVATLGLLLGTAVVYWGTQSITREVLPAAESRTVRAWKATREALAAMKRAQTSNPFERC